MEGCGLCLQAAPPVQIARLRGRQIASGNFSAFGYDLVLDALSFRQRRQSGVFDGTYVDEHVLAAVFRLDESESTGGVEKFYGSDSHDGLLDINTNLTRAAEPHAHYA